MMDKMQPIDAQFSVQTLPSGPLPQKSLEERSLRELALRSCDNQWDERTPLERVFDYILAARMTYYGPMLDPGSRRDIPCMCCGNLYRPDDPSDAMNMFLCLTCIYIREGK